MKWVYELAVYELPEELSDMVLYDFDKLNNKVQLPAGSHIILNLKKANEYGLKCGVMALSVANRIIE